MLLCLNTKEVFIDDHISKILNIHLFKINKLFLIVFTNNYYIGLFK